MKRYILSICIIASALSMLAQKTTSRTFASPNGVLKVQIDTNEGKLHYSVYEGTLEGGNIYAQANSIALNIEGAGKNQYTISTPKIFKEHFDAFNYKLASFDDSYNQVIVNNKNGE